MGIAMGLCGVENAVGESQGIVSALVSIGGAWGEGETGAIRAGLVLCWMLVVAAERALVGAGDGRASASGGVVFL
jgi:hypothetical protein